jgi:predicted small lipoprotein YifL
MIRSFIFNLFVGASLLACGSRGPLDLSDPVLDASVEAGDAGVVDAKADAATEPSPGQELLECGLCVTQKCGGKVTRCIQDPQCSQVLQCVLQKCVLNGFNLQCVTQCQDDPQGALKAFEIILCITSTCGDSCGGAIPPLGGLGGFPGTGG